MSNVERQAKILAPWLRPEGPAPADIPEDAAAWTGLMQMAVDAGLSGVVLETARACGVAIPDGPRAALERQAGTIAAANLNLAAELERVLLALNAADVPVMLLKGAALTAAATKARMAIEGRELRITNYELRNAERPNTIMQRAEFFGDAARSGSVRIYDRPDLRPMTDADLLVMPSDAARALGVLVGADCRRGAELLREDFFPRYYYEMELWTGGPSPLRIDLHARPFRPLRTARTMPDDALWDGAAAARVGAARAHVPSPETMLIHLCAHAAFHGCSRLTWLYDIARFTRFFGSAIDWHAVIDRSVRWHLAPAVSAGLRATTDALGPVFPEEILRALQLRRGSWRDRLVLRTAPRDAQAPLRHVLVNLLCTPGIRFRAGYAAAVMTPDRGHLEGQYPFRHIGWPACARAWRGLRALRRLLPV